MGSTGIAVMDSILDFVKPVLEYSEAEQEPDHDRHQNQTRAQHAYLTPAAHPAWIPRKLKRLAVWFGRKWVWLSLLLSQI